MESKYYKQIMELPGAEEVKAAVREWETLYRNIGRVKPGVSIVLPDYLLLTKMGAGKSTVLHLMADYLHDIGLMNFQGDKNVVEFHLENNRGSDGFSELGRLAQTISSAAGFRAGYYGIVAIDCSEWVDDFESNNMKALLAYLMENSRDWLIFLVLDCDDEDKIETIEAIVSAYLRINILHLPHISVNEMVYFVIAHIEDYGMKCAPDVRDLLQKSLEVLEKQKHFSGYHALEMLAEEIVYTVYSNGGNIPSELTAAMLPDFTPDGAYIQQQVQYGTKLTSIGF